MDFVSKVERLIGAYAFSHHGVAPLKDPLSLDFYRAWLAAGHHGDMTYLEYHLPLKEQPEKLAPRARSAIVVAKAYLPHPYGCDEALGTLRAALYAQGRDYHLEFRRDLEGLARALAFEFPREEFLCFTDSAPILERDLAYRAGLGWVGKNTCLIHPQHGSLFFLGQILTSIEVTASASAIHDFCGSCDRCLKACPTGALEEPRRLNATKCIAYWTIEARAAAPEELRSRFGDWFFGCDICQTVCPWNEKRHGRDLMRTLGATLDERANDVADLRSILTSSNQALSRRFRQSPLSRARPRGLKRNALLVIANRRLRELRPEVEGLVGDVHLNDIARWTLAQLT
jgi:epoxyqueuosine reductase